MATDNKKSLEPLTALEREWLRRYTASRVQSGHSVYTTYRLWDEDHHHCDTTAAIPVFFNPFTEPTSLRVANCSTHRAVYINRTDEDDFVVWVREVRNGALS